MNLAKFIYESLLFNGEKVSEHAEALIEKCIEIDSQSRPTQRAGDVCHVCGAKLPALTRQCVVCGTRA
jgi:hypothetical protein